MSAPKKTAILAELIKNPCRTSQEIAAAAGSTQSSVRTVASLHGIRFGKPGAPKLLTDENRAWLLEQAAAERCSLPDMLNAIITDARCEAEEAGNG